jgi:adenine-specific DNA methylase
MSHTMHPLEFLGSLAGGVVAGLLIVLVLGHFSPGTQPVRATLVNCAAVRARSRQDSATPISEEQRRAERQCADPGLGSGAVPTPALGLGLNQGAGVAAPTARPGKAARTHGWRKTATPPAN